MSDPRARVEQRRGWRLKLLHALYEMTDGDPAYVINDVWSVGEELGIPREDAWETLAYLSQEGLAEQANGGGGMSITHEGVKEVEAALSAPARPSARFPAARNVIRIERAVNTVIQQGNVGSTQSVRIEGAVAEDVNALVRAVADALERMGAAHAEREELRAQLDALRAQLAAPKPRFAAVRDAATAIRDVLEGITRSGKAVGEGLTLLGRARAVVERLGR
jgi:hypothetical protein